MQYLLYLAHHLSSSVDELLLGDRGQRLQDVTETHNAVDPTPGHPAALVLVWVKLHLQTQINGGTWCWFRLHTTCKHR